MFSFLKGSIVCVAFLSSPICMSLLLPAVQFNWGKDNQDKELTETVRKIYSEPKFSIGQDFPKGVLSYIRRYSWKEFIWKMLCSS